MTRYWIIVGVSALAALFVAGSLVGSEMPQQGHGRSVREFLSPDGRFDLEAAKASGYQGPLDKNGFDVTLDPVSGEPVAHPYLQQAPKDDPDDIFWAKGFNVPGANAPVSVLIVYDDKLIVGGSFTTVCGIAASGIAAWDGFSWSSLGSGIGGEVYALVLRDKTSH